MGYVLFCAVLVLAAPYVSGMFMRDSPDQAAARARMPHPGCIPLSNGAIFVGQVAALWWGFDHYSWWLVILSWIATYVFSIAVVSRVLASIPGASALSMVAVPILAVVLWLI